MINCGCGCATCCPPEPEPTAEEIAASKAAMYAWAERVVEYNGNPPRRICDPAPLSKKMSKDDYKAELAWAVEYIASK